MGCAGSLPGMPEVPEIELDTDAINEAIQTQCEEIPNNVEKNLRNFPDEVKKCEDAEWEVEGTKGTLKLKKEYTEAELVTAAIVAACGDAVREAMKDAIWAQFEPACDEQLEKVEIPEKFKKQVCQKAKDKVKENTVDLLVDKAVDACLEEIKKAKENSGGAAEEEQ